MAFITAGRLPPPMKIQSTGLRTCLATGIRGTPYTPRVGAVGCDEVTHLPDRIETPLGRLLGVRYPIIAAPMFLVSNVDMVVAVGEAGGLGAFPSLNFRTTDELRAALGEIRRRTQTPFGV